MNPLLDVSGPPRYDRIRAEHAEPAVRQLAEETEALLERLVAEGGPPTWAGFVVPLDDAGMRLERAWSAVQNLDATLGTEDLREARRKAQEIVVRHASKLAQDERLYRAERTVAEGPGADAHPPVRRKILADRMRDFRLAGAHLPAPAKARCAEIRSELATLGSTFADHVTDDARRYRLVLDRPEQVAPLPAPLVASARALALADDPAAPPELWSFSLDQSTVLPFTANQPDRALREEFLRAWSTRASAEPFDNGPLIPRILGLRKELAGLLGFANYAEVSLVSKMARTPSEVRAFLLDLADRGLPHGRRETAELTDESRRGGGPDRLERHDLAFWRERLRTRLHGFTQEDLRPYFPLPRVVSGLGVILRRLYGVTLRDATDDGTVATWHPDVRVLELSEDGRAIGHVLFDPCTRTGKRAGAWVSSCVTRHRTADGTLHEPVAHLVCNFPPAVGGRPSLLSHDDVRTLFHEFGHALHNVLTTVDHGAAAGTHGVPWDGVEFPSQFHENWVWHPDAVALVSGHVETGEPLPADLLERLRASRGFCAASDLLRQVELALFDLELHTEFDPQRDDVRALVESVRNRVAVVPAAPWDRFENSFMHVFLGGYAAGYYGYKWAEVLAADAFGRFEEEGIFATHAARDFRETVLSKGGSEDLLALFERFRGRAPDATALFRQCGIG